MQGTTGVLFIRIHFILESLDLKHLLIAFFLFEQINGEYKFDVENSKLKSLDKWLDYSDILFEVNVTESITGLRQNASGTVRFYPHENKVEFLESLPKTYKPGLKYTVLVS